MEEGLRRLPDAWIRDMDGQSADGAKGPRRRGWSFGCLGHQHGSNPPWSGIGWFVYLVCLVWGCQVRQFHCSGLNSRLVEEMGGGNMFVLCRNLHLVSPDFSPSFWFDL
ncbi:hypothetical protein SETIT_1G132400v2 [Setaria italica]|uniref:Uncharacterized protein n=1 Tax=Setaria italica TaxID=4555 RepID=A0A368PM16_SETIT|nr:hypothetical protein SETIT_1G132400v2 [Setaria italica]